MTMSIASNFTARRQPLPIAFVKPIAKLAVRDAALPLPAGNITLPSARYIASAAGSSPSMAQAFADNRLPKGTAAVTVNMLLTYSGLKRPAKDPSLKERFLGTEWGRVEAALKVAAESVNKPELYKRYNPGFHYDKKGGTLMFADSAQGAQAFKSFIMKFTYLTTDRNGQYSEEAKTFIKEGLPLLTSQFGEKLHNGLQKIEADVKASENSEPMRFLRAMDTLSSIAQNIAGVRGAGRKVALPATQGQRITPVSTGIRRAIGSTQSPDQNNRIQTNRSRRQAAALPQPITNSERSAELFADPAKLATHFHARPLGNKPGQSPTSYFFGGHATSGPFAGITGRTAGELMANVRERVAQLKADGVLESLGSGAYNNVYIHKPTGRVIRVGNTNSEEMSATVSYSNLRGPNTGAQLDLAQSLYIPVSAGLDKKNSYGIGVLVMERVPGITLKQFIADNPNGASRLAQVPDKVADALVNMHMNRRTHGDVHKGNILFDEATGNVQIIDFGKAKRTADIGQRSLDLRRLGGLIDYVRPPGSRITIANQTQIVYMRALERYPAPDRNAPIYQKHPHLYNEHMARFNTRRSELLKQIESLR